SAPFGLLPIAERPAAPLSLVARPPGGRSHACDVRPGERVGETGDMVYAASSCEPCAKEAETVACERPKRHSGIRREPRHGRKLPREPVEAKCPVVHARHKLRSARRTHLARE